MTDQHLNMVSNTPSNPIPTSTCTFAAAAGTSGRRFLRLARLSTESSFTPFTRSMTSTSDVLRSSMTVGTTTRSLKQYASNSSRNSAIFAASAVKSNSPAMTSRYARKIVGKSTPLSRPSRFITSVV